MFPVPPSGTLNWIKAWTRHYYPPPPPTPPVLLGLTKLVETLNHQKRDLAHHEEHCYAIPEKRI